MKSQRNVDFKVTNPETAKVKAKFSLEGRDLKPYAADDSKKEWKRFPSFGMGCVFVIILLIEKHV